MQLCSQVRGACPCRRKPPSLSEHAASHAHGSMQMRGAHAMQL